MQGAHLGSLGGPSARQPRSQKPAPISAGRPVRSHKEGKAQRGPAMGSSVTASPAGPEPKASASQGRAPGRTPGRGMTVLTIHGRMVTTPRTRRGQWTAAGGQTVSTRPRPPQGRRQTLRTQEDPGDILSLPGSGQEMATWPQEIQEAQDGDPGCRREGCANATHPSSRQPGSCACKRPLVPGLGASPLRACPAPPKPREPSRMFDSGQGRSPRSHTHQPAPGLAVTGTAQGGSRSCTENLGLPLAARGSLPALVGHCWTDTGGKKQEKACLGATQPLPARRQPVGPPCSALSPALRAPTRTWGARAPS